jgi:hypothetical protein
MSTLNALTSGGGVALSGDTTGNLVIQSAGTNTAVFTTGGNLGIGTTSPDANSLVTFSATTPNSKLRLAGGTSQNGLTFASAGGGNQFYVYSQSGGLVTYDDTAGAERMRIDAGGNVCVNTTSTISSAKLSVACAGSGPISGIGINDTNSSNGTPFIIFQTGGTNRGSITNNANAGVAYNTTVSDYRLKENVTNFNDGLNKINALRPVSFTWKETGKDDIGFIAHELQAVVPECVNGDKDGMFEETPQYQLVFPAPAQMIANLVSAIKELNAKVDAQAAEIAALKGA